MNYKETYQEWLSNPYFDEDTKKELTAIENDENEIKERFYADLAFGTAGLRGIIGIEFRVCILLTIHTIFDRDFYDLIWSKL